MSEIPGPIHQELFSTNNGDVFHTPTGDIPSTEKLDGEQVVWQDMKLDPRLFDEYHGSRESLDARLIHVNVQDSGDQYVIRMVSIENPDFNEADLEPGQEARTLYIMGGGLSDAVTGLAIAAHMLDADARNIDDKDPDKPPTKGPFRIKNVVILSHPDDQPRNVKHTDPEGTDSSLARSAAIVEKAIKQASKPPGEPDQSKTYPISVEEGHIMMIGHSAGAQMSVELAQDLGVQELILIESTGMSDLPNLTKEFGWGTIKSVFHDTERKGINRFNIPRRLWRTSHDLLKAFTDAYGPYQGGWLGFLRFVDFARLNKIKVPKSMQDKIRAGEYFGIAEPFLPANPNPHTLDHDSTEKQRADFHGKVTLVNKLQVHVANLLTSKAGFTREELAEYDAIISRITQRKTGNPREKLVLTEKDLEEENLSPELIERFYKRLAEGSTSLLTELFPNAQQRRIILDQGFSHFRMLQDPTFYERLMTEVKSSTE